LDEELEIDVAKKQGTIDPDSVMPKYLQIARSVVVDYINNKSYAHDYLPSIPLLSQQYGVAKATVERGIQYLKDKGEVYSEKGRKTYIRSRQRKASAKALERVVLVDGSLGIYNSLIETGVSELAHYHGLELSIVHTSPEKAEAQLHKMKLLNSDGTTGYLFALPGFAHRPLIDLLRERNLPHVIVNNQSFPESPTVGVDNHKGAQKAVRALSRSGHSRIAYLGAHTEEDVPRCERLTGYLEGLHLFHCDHDEKLVFMNPADKRNVPDAYKLAVKAFKSKQRFTTCLAMNYQFLLGALLAAKDCGLRVPDDVALVGFDHQEHRTADMVPSLSVVSYSAHDLGRLAILTLLNRTRGELMIPSVRIRESIGLP
jgi:DNA-binding LacI/PurR family transcriptional regulator